MPEDPRRKLGSHFGAPAASIGRRQSHCDSPRVECREHRNFGSDSRRLYAADARRNAGTLRGDPRLAKRRDAQNDFSPSEISETRNTRSIDDGSGVIFFLRGGSGEEISASDQPCEVIRNTSGCSFEPRSSRDTSCGSPGDGNSLRRRFRRPRLATRRRSSPCPAAIRTAASPPTSREIATECGDFLLARQLQIRRSHRARAAYPDRARRGWDHSQIKAKAVGRFQHNTLGDPITRDVHDFRHPLSCYTPADARSPGTLHDAL